MDDDFEYCGDCVVCGDPVDHSKAGFCECGAFCWSHCGDWHNGKHKCKTCIEIEGDEEE